MDGMLLLFGWRRIAWRDFPGTESPRLCPGGGNFRYTGLCAGRIIWPDGLEWRPSGLLFKLEKPGPMVRVRIIGAADNPAARGSGWSKQRLNRRI